ncbi:carboxyl-terminal protease [Ammonifex degensii KC4]|uniref:Carboxyl-terminal protease n=1 Tax=Ammonifex degensii (strain DSM 10501 / KC4) TaxID=429009 RepID=C9RBJ8_AMMDK|nr:S41 family peptidase [Ammonifex degensii]ACX51625.1 carboxyl-terminal protease [Ammonifex degensii KC4]
MYTSSKRWFLGVILALALFLLGLGGGLYLGLGVNKNGQLANLLEVMRLISQNYVEEVSWSRLIEGAIKGAVESLHDPYSAYLDPSTFTQLREQIRGSFGGVGLVVGLKDHQLTVLRTFPDTPAGRAGIEPGDVITSINGRQTKGIDLETAVGLIRGPVGTEVTLTLYRPQKGSFELTLRREEIAVPTVEAKMLTDKIGYVAVSQFTERTPEELGQALRDLQKKGMMGLILDLRDNPGGELVAAVKVAEFFVPAGPVVYIDYRNREAEVYRASGRRIDLPLVVLVNGNSASAAEIVAAAIKETGSGVLVGTRTFGKGVVQTVYPLRNGAGLKLTTARYLTPLKHDINKIGVEPTVLVEQPPDTSTDLQLSKAQEILLQKMSQTAGRKFGLKAS